VLALISPAAAQDKPPLGGEYLLVPSEPPSYDGTGKETFGVVHPLAALQHAAAHRPDDRTGTKPVADLAESWTISPDG